MKLQDLNRQRVESHRKLEEQEQFLRNVGEALRAEERASYFGVDPKMEKPIIFVLGLPRSGTTLLAQVLAHYLDVGYINNFMARFWLAPVTGIKLANVMIGDCTDIDFASDHATTIGWNNLHEFGYFWRHWLRIDDPDGPKAQPVDWDGLRETLFNMQLAFDKSMIFKNLFGISYISELGTFFPKALFVHIRRNPMDVMISNVHARRAFYKDPTTWWSIAPPEYPELKDLPLYEQVAGQVYYLNRFFAKQLSRISPTRVLHVDYKALCDQPKLLATEVAEHAGCELTSALARQFTFREYSSNLEDYRQFDKVCKEEGYPVA